MSLAWRLPTTFLLLVLCCALTLACSDDDDDDSRLRVVATTTQIGDLVKNVAGDRVRLTVLLAANQDAHDFELSPSQVRAVAQADLLLRNGIGLDSFVLDAAENSDARIVIATEGIDLRGGGDDSEAAGADPHVWFAVDNYRVMLRNVREALVQADPANEVDYRESASRYMAELIELDGRIRQQVSQVPQDCRKLVTNHDTFGYYAEAYGFSVVGSVIPSVSTSAQPSASDVAEIVRLIRQERVPAIFAETSSSPDLIRQVGREANVEVVDDLYGDSLGPAGSDGDTYVKMMEANTARIVEALRRCEDAGSR